MPAMIDLANQRFGRLLVLGYMPTDHKEITWLCQCDCGMHKVVTTRCLRKGRTKSCGCLRTEVLPDSGAAKTEMLGSYRYQAKRRNLVFELKEDIFFDLINQDCYYCNAAPVQNVMHTDRHRGLVCNGIDRLNNNVGYTIENSVPCCKPCNIAKNKSTLVEYIERSKRIAEKWKI